MNFYQSILIYTKETTLKLESHEIRHQHKSPLGGWGVGSGEPPQIFFLRDYNLIKEEEKMFLSHFNVRESKLTNYWGKS